MLTAQEAREIAGGSNIDKHVENALDRIRVAATNKLHYVELKGTFWGDEGFRQTVDYHEAVELLTTLGYNVSLSFIDIKTFSGTKSVFYTIVKW
jgi:hypothetical protein